LAVGGAAVSISNSDFGENSSLRPTVLEKVAATDKRANPIQSLPLKAVIA
jgi:hypothetical protein